MYKDLLIVFSNYNGNRSCNDLSEARIKITIDSFRKQCKYSDDLNVLLLDNNSNDGSENTLQNYKSKNWEYVRKTTEDYYLGTLYKLLSEYKNQYKYLMVVDNDHFFFRENFLEAAIPLMKSKEGIVCLQMNEVTKYDLIDHYKQAPGVAGIFEKVGVCNNQVWLRSARFKGDEPGFNRLPPSHGLGIMKIPEMSEKRICWLYFAASNCIINMSAFSEIFKNPSLKPPYFRNADRLALFASSVREVGHSAYLGRGASINIGFRKFLPNNMSVKSLVQKYADGVKSLYMSNGYSFFIKNKNIYPIETAIREITKER